MNCRTFSKQIASINLHGWKPPLATKEDTRADNGVHRCSMLFLQQFWSLTPMAGLSVALFRRFISLQLRVRKGGWNQKGTSAFARHLISIRNSHIQLDETLSPLPDAVANKEKLPSWEEAWIDIGGEG
jgi:hypothetical protein